MSVVVQDANGFPVLLADVAPAGVAKVDPNAKSGNDAHDVRSGKFARKPGSEEPDQPPANVNPIEYKRMLDAVRDAAREFDTPDTGDITEFLKGRAKNPAVVNIQQFLVAVHEQRLNDLVDALDTQIRSNGKLNRGRRKVKINIPRGYLRRIYGSLDESQTAEVMHRLEAMGHDAADVEAFFDGKVKEDIFEKAKATKAGIQASDQWEAEPFSYSFDQEDSGGWSSEAIEMAEVIAKNIQPPVIHLQPNINVAAPEIHPQITVEAPRPTRSVVQRNEQGFITSVEQVSE